MADSIQVRGLRVMGTHGVLPEERQRAQPFEVDLDLQVDVTRAGATDDLDDTVDYGAVIELVDRLVSTESCRLLETLAQRIADAVLSEPTVAAVTVAVRKLHPPVAADVTSVGVSITRSR
ncbi:MAG TPA: dihydroneopterin aldolase [Acidimicrobiales bacterium]|nr:dihydroneopterin aldolase [Acidimicrobiales bacterium]